MIISRAVIFNGVVENIIEADENFQLPDREIVDLVGVVHVGDYYAAGVFTRPIITPPTSAELDAIAEAAHAKFEQDAKIEALGKVIADLAEVVFDVDQPAARAQVKSRWIAYFREKLD